MMNCNLDYSCDVGQTSLIKACKQESKKKGFLTGGLFRKKTKQSYSEMYDGGQPIMDYECEKLEEAKIEYKSSIPIYQKSLNFVQDFDYIEESGLVLDNLKPDDSGLIRVPLEKFKKYSQLTIIAADVYGTDIATHVLRKADIKKVEMRLEKPKPAGVIYTEERYCLTGGSNNPVVIQDLKNTQSTIIVSIKEAYDSLMTVCFCDQTQVSKWKFLTIWNTLTENLKLKKWQEFGGDELNVFLFMKDRAFFEEKIKPILSFKAEFTLTDRLLIGEQKTLQHLIHPSVLVSLSPLHLALLLIQTKDNSLKNQIEELLKNLTHSIKSKDFLVRFYDSILASKSDEAPLQEEKDYSQNNYKCQEADSLLDKKKVVGDKKEKKEKMISKKMSKGAVSKDMDLLGLEEQQLPEKKLLIKYQDIGSAKEYGERDIWFSQNIKDKSMNDCVVPEYLFWVDIINSILQGNKGLFLSENFMSVLTKHPYNIVYILAFLDLEFTKSAVETVTKGKDLVLGSTQNFLVLCKRIEEKTTPQFKMDIIVNQKFYDPVDKYKYDEVEADVKTLKQVDEFLVGKIYSSEITITNTSENTTHLKLITQIPEGSIAVNNLQPLNLEDITLASMSTLIKTFKFYFPHKGIFDYYPATVMNKNRFVTHSPKNKSLTAVEKFTRGGKAFESLEDILNYGSKDDIINFMQAKNLHNPRLFNTSRIMWMLAEEKYYKKIVEIMRSKCIFDHRVWAYSLKHQDFESFKELLDNHKNLQDIIFSQPLFFQNKYISFDKFVTLEYDPLINPRAYNINEGKQNIRNVQFGQTYLQFLEYCSQRGTLTEREWIIFAGYLSLQDRFEEASSVLALKVDPKRVEHQGIMQVQYDYMRAYLAVYTEYPEFNTTRTIVEKYLTFPDISWRKRFLKVKEQLMEYDGLQEIKDEELEEGNLIQHNSNAVQVKKTEYMKVELSQDEKSLDLTHMNITSVDIKYFAIDLEQVFSKDPFLDANLRNISYLETEKRQKVQLNAQKANLENEFETFPASSKIELPLLTKPHIVHVSTPNFSQSEVIKVFPSKFKVQVLSSIGMLKIRGQSNNPIPGAYVKVFAKNMGQTGAKFYKDGYSDFTGTFDYCSLNSGALEKVEKFSVYVKVSEDVDCAGEVVVDAAKPGKAGELIGN